MKKKNLGSNIYFNKKTNKYDVNVTVTFKTNEHKSFCRRGFSTVEDARRYVDSVKNRGCSEPTPVDKMTFLEVAEKYFDAKETTRNTRKQRMQQIVKHFKYYNDRIVEINKQDLVEWRINLINSKSLKSYTKNIVMGVIRRILKWAVINYDIKDISIVLEPIVARDDEIYYPATTELDDFKKFLEYVDDVEYRDAFEFLFWTGLRRCELFALQKSDVDLENKRVHVTKQLKNIKEGFKDPKNKYSIRWVDLDDVTFAIVKKHLKTDGPFLFGGLKPLTCTELDRKRKAAISKAGVPYFVNHGLRHSHASNLMDTNAADVVSIANRLGHATIETTIENYIHTTKEGHNRLIFDLNRLRKKG